MMGTRIESRKRRQTRENPVIEATRPMMMGRIKKIIRIFIDGNSQKALFEGLLRHHSRDGHFCQQFCNIGPAASVVTAVQRMQYQTVGQYGFRQSFNVVG